MPSLLHESQVNAIVERHQASRNGFNQALRNIVKSHCEDYDPLPQEARNFPRKNDPKALCQCYSTRFMNFWQPYPDA